MRVYDDDGAALCPAHVPLSVLANTARRNKALTAARADAKTRAALLTRARATMGTNALLARLAELDQRREDAAREARGIACSTASTSGASGSARATHPAGIDYDRTPVLSSKQGSAMPAPEWYLSLCAAVDAPGTAAPP